MIKSNNNTEKIIKEIATRSNRAVDTQTRALLIESKKPGVVPVYTGATKEKTYSEVKIGQHKATGTVDTKTEHAKYPYYGTSKMPPGGRTGIGKWIEKSAEKIKVKEALKEGLKW